MNVNLDGMSDYERKAWDALLKGVARRKRRRVAMPESMRRLGAKSAAKAQSTWERLPGAESFEAMLAKALRGLYAVTFQPAMSSVNTDRVVDRMSARHPQVGGLSDFRALDLSVCDAAVPRVRTGYAVTAAIEGGTTAVAVTGTVVSSTVSAGVTAPVAVAAIATDTVATMALMGRGIAVVASRYGYDVKQPEEEIFAMGVMSLASATTTSGKVAAMASLSRLAQQMMRQATWAQLRRHHLVSVIERIYLALGFKLTKGKLSQAVPIAGIVINAGLSAELTDRTFRAASYAYRLRFLSDKYGIDPGTWMATLGDPTDDGPADEEVVRVDEFMTVEETRAEAQA